MYILTLTHDERKAIDWVDYRYATGRPFWYLLTNDEVSRAWEPYQATMEQIEDDSWNWPIDIQFDIPEHIAWEIKDLFEQEDMLFPCFSEEFKSKLIKFYEEIV